LRYPDVVDTIVPCRLLCRLKIRIPILAGTPRDFLIAAIAMSSLQSPPKEQNAETEAENGLRKWHAFRRPV
jgi:hypothetical protein